MKISVVLLAFYLCLTSFITSAQNNYTLISGRNGKVVTVNDIVADMGKADVLFFGEEHDDPTGHQMENEILRALAEKYPAKTALSLEMLTTDKQLVADEYIQSLIREKEFLADAWTWPNLNDYKPMLDFTRQKRLPVIAANAPARYVNRVTRMGMPALDSLSTDAKQFLPPLPLDTLTGKYYDKFSKLMGGHSAMPGMNLYQAQNVWDATMAWSIGKFIQSHAGWKVLHLCGGFHAEDKLGTVEQLSMKYGQQLKVLTLVAVSDKNWKNPDRKAYSGKADYILLTNPDLPRTR